MRQLETVQMVVGGDPKIHFARVDKLLNTQKSVRIVKEEREIVRIIVRNLSNEYVVERCSHPLTRPNISRFEVEKIVRASYANRKYSDLGKLSVAVPAKAPPSVVIGDPRTPAVGGGLRGGGTGGQRKSRGGPGGGGRGQQQGGRGQQQQWSQGWNGQLPSHGGGQMWQQPFHQRQHAAATVPAAAAAAAAAAAVAAAIFSSIAVTVSAAIRSVTAAATTASPFLSSRIAQMVDRGGI